MSKVINEEFDPTIFHPYYIIRKGLLEGVKKYSASLTGKMLDFGCGSKPYKSLFKVDEYIGLDYYNEGHPHGNEEIDFFTMVKHFLLRIMYLTL